MEQLMTIKEACYYTRLSKSQMYRLASRKGFNAVRIGHAVRIPQSVLEEVIRGGFGYDEK